MIKNRIMSVIIVLVLVLQIFFSCISAAAAEVGSSAENKLNNIVKTEVLSDVNTALETVIETLMETDDTGASGSDTGMLRNVLSSYSDVIDETYSMSLISKKEWLEMFIDVFNLKKYLEDTGDTAQFNCDNIFELGDEKDMYLAEEFSNDPYTPLKRKEAGDTIVLYLGYPLKEFTSNDNDELAIQTYLQTALYYGYLQLDDEGNANPSGYLTREDFESIRDDLLKYVEFRGKTVFGFGDSIMAGDGNHGDGIAEVIADKYKMNVYDYGFGGATFGYREDRPSIHEQVSEAVKSEVVPDYILVDGGTNDYKLKRMGSIAPDDDYNYLVNGYTTFASGMEYCFGLLRDHYYDVPCLYIRTHEMFIYPEQQKTYAELGFDICRKWSMPYVDLYSDSGFDADDKDSVYRYTYHTDDYPDGDGVHPNQDMYMEYYTPLVSDALYNISKY